MTIRVNITSRVNQDMISRREKNGREQIVIRSVVARDDTTLNGILYTGEELTNAMGTLDRTPAPFGHPVDDSGAFLPSSDPEAINGFYFGAFNENPRREGNRIVADKIIDVKRARENEQGRRVLDAIDQGDPIHTSTGLYCELERDNETNEDIARNIIFDHDAILLDEEGAITPEQGVGMMVNAKATDRRGKPVDAVYNSMYEEDFNREVEWAIESIARAAERREERERIAPLMERIKSAIAGILPTMREPETEANEDQDMSDVTKDQFDALSAKVNDLVDAVGKLDIEAAVTNAIKPVTDKVDGLVQAQNADAEAKKKSLVERVVNKQLLTEDVAKETPVAALEAMLNASGGTAANLIGGFKGDDKSSTLTNKELPED